MSKERCIYCNYTTSSLQKLAHHILDTHYKLLTICPVCLNGKVQKCGKYRLYYPFSGAWGLYLHCNRAQENKEWHYALAYLLKQGFKWSKNVIMHPNPLQNYRDNIDKIRKHIMKHQYVIDAKRIAFATRKRRV